MGIISTSGLTKRYGSRVGVDRVDLDVREGEIFGFLGPNGAGKTTTIRVLLGFLRPTAGAARIFDLDCWRDGHRIRRDIGYVPGDLRVYPWMTVRSGLRFVSRVRGRDLTAAGLDLAERFELDTTVRARSMSRGMRQKLGLVLALAHAPRLLVLDEPTSGLDPLMQDQLADELRGLAARGHTVFFSSHSLGEVEQLCDRIAVVRRGELAADETLAALRERARRRVTIRFRDANDAAAVEPPPILRLRHRTAHTWQAELEGTVPELVGWLATQPIDDLTLGPPDLESLFRAYYDDDDDEGLDA